MDSLALPIPSDNQSYWDVSALEAGHLWLDLPFFTTAAKPGEQLETPSLAFLLRHSATKKNFLFDMGIRKDVEAYPPPVHTKFAPLTRTRIPQDVAESLEKGGLSTNDVEYICVSHCHWDHIGNPALFPKAKFLLGGEAIHNFEPGYPDDPTSFYESGTFPSDRTEFIPVDDWKPIGPFPRALDYFGDGSLYIIDAPGHLRGHINLLARTSADGAWIYLAGDSAHHWSLITGEGEIAGAPDGLRRFGGCAHENKEEAAATQRRIRELMKLPRAHVIIAHDEPWYQKHKGGSAFWPGKIDSL